MFVQEGSGEAVSETLLPNRENARGSLHRDIIVNEGGSCDLEASAYIHPKSETANTGAESNDWHWINRIGGDMAWRWDEKTHQPGR
jgi:hypothetical protein